MDASYFSFLRTNDFRCVFRYYYGVNANTELEYTCCKYLVDTKHTSLDETVVLSFQEIMLKLMGKKIHKHCVRNLDLSLYQFAVN